MASYGAFPTTTAQSLWEYWPIPPSGLLACQCLPTIRLQVCTLFGKFGTDSLPTCQPVTRMPSKKDFRVLDGVCAEGIQPRAITVYPCAIADADAIGPDPKSRR